MSFEKHFSNYNCPHYPCHEIPDQLNCLFCFCPLYHLAECGGNPRTTDASVRDCSHCILPHAPDGYEYIMDRLTYDRIQSRFATISTAELFNIESALIAYTSDKKVQSSYPGFCNEICQIIHGLEDELTLRMGNPS